MTFKNFENIVNVIGSGGTLAVGQLKMGDAEAA